MKKVYIKGKPLTLKKEIGGGQEALVFDAGNNYAIKVYRQPSDPYYSNNPLEKKAAKARIITNQKKLKAYPKGFPNTVLTPSGLVTNKKGIIIGFAMPFLKGTETLLQYGNRSFRETTGIDNAQMQRILLSMHNTITGVHKTNTVIGDFNDANVLIKDDIAYFIDTDSWQFPGYPCTMFTAKFVDPLLCSLITLNGSEQMNLSMHHNEMGDWYSYNVMVFQSLLYTDPYGGIHKPKDKKKKVKQSLRAIKRTTVFDPNVVYPKVATHWSALPDDLLEHFNKVFKEDKRIIFPKNLLETMIWKQCNKCHTYHARHICPSCNHRDPTRVVRTTKVRGTVTAHTLFTTKGIILQSSLRNDKIQYLYHTNNEFYRENKKNISSGKLGKMRYRIHHKNTLFATANGVLVIDMDGSHTKIMTDTIGNLPIIDTTANHVYWLNNGTIQRENALGFTYQNQSLGSGINGRTLLWAGESWGFGFWRAGNLSQGFIFDDKQSLIKSLPNIPSIKGSLLDATCVFSKTHGWLLYTSQEGSDRINHCVLFDKSGTFLSHESTLEGSNHWLGTIRGKSAVGTLLFSPHDDGIIRSQYTGNTWVSKEYTDTEPFVTSNSVLHVSSHGIYVQNSKNITLLTIS